MSYTCLVLFNSFCLIQLLSLFFQVLSDSEEVVEDVEADEPVDDALMIEPVAGSSGHVGDEVLCPSTERANNDSCECNY